MHRRDCLKLIAFTGLSLVDGCDSPTKRSPASYPSNFLSSDAYELGAVPIKDSGWAGAGDTQVEYPRLENDLDTPVLVVGAGLSGSALALSLVEAGIEVIVIDTHQPGWGASGRNAGHIASRLRDRSVFNKFPDNGKAFLELFRENHSITFDIAKQYNINCDSVQSGYLQVTNQISTFNDLTNQAKYWRDEQGQKVECISGSDVQNLTGSRYYKYGVFYENGGRINPYLFSHGMIRAAVDRGGKGIWG